MRRSANRSALAESITTPISFRDSLLHYSNLGLARATPDVLLDGEKKFRGFNGDASSEYRTLVPNQQYADIEGWINAQGTQQWPVLRTQIETTLKLARLIQAHGAIPIMVQMPQTGNWVAAVSLARGFSELCTNAGPAFFNFESPSAYPVLWDAKNHQDDDHLNAKGAVIFSSLLAHHLSEAIVTGELQWPLCNID